MCEFRKCNIKCECVCARVCVCVRIGELREAMADILRRQCDYDPASGDNYDFDR